MVNWLLGHSLFLDTWQNPCLEVLAASFSILFSNSCKRMLIVYLSCTFDCPIQIMIILTSVECGFLGGQNLHIDSCFFKKKKKKNMGSVNFLFTKFWLQGHAKECRNCMGIFRTPLSLILAVYISIQYKPCFTLDQ
jgi:hypothetical protein